MHTNSTLTLRFEECEEKRSEERMRLLLLWISAVNPGCRILTHEFVKHEVNMIININS